MTPNVEYDYDNDIAYLTFSNNRIVKSIESDDELLVFDVDKYDKLVGIEILSVKRLLSEMGFSQTKKNLNKPIEPNQIPTYLIPRIYNYSNQ